jgi:hypothetical protein
MVVHDPFSVRMPEHHDSVPPLPVSASAELGSGTDFVKSIVLPCAGDAPSLSGGC